MGSSFWKQSVCLFVVILATIFCCSFFSCGDDDDDSSPTPTSIPSPTPTQTSSFQISSTAFTEGETIPVQYTCDGEDISPPLVWTDSPANTSSYVLLMSDPDAPNGTWHHWGVYDIPSDRSGLEENIPRGEQYDSFYQARTDFGYAGYGGPCPPSGHGPHRYFFRLLALDVATLGLDGGSDYSVVESAAEGHILAETSLMGIYER